MSGKRRAGGSESPRVKTEHFRLLKTFGRNDLQRRASDAQRNEFWRMVCESTPGVEFVPHEDVIAAWKKFITGNAVESGLALNGDIDPSYVSVGVTYKRRMFAAHTTRMRPLLKRLMSIYIKAFGTRAEFLDAMESLSKEIAEPKKKKKRSDK